MRWVDTNKGDTINWDVRSRLVARDFKGGDKDRDDLFAATPPLEAKKMLDLKLTRILYFQKLDANAGVGHRIIQQAHRQRTCELIVACYALQRSEEALSPRRLRRRCERILREAVDVEIDFQIDRVLRSLKQMNAAVSDGKRWRLTSLESLS